MKILAISSILPVPDIIKYNDFVFQLYETYRNIYSNDTVVIIKPVKIDLNPKKFFQGTSQLSLLKNQYSRSIKNFRVEIFPFYSSKKWMNLHAILTGSIYFLNRKRIHMLLSTYKFDVIHAQYIFPDGLLANALSKKFHIPYFVTSHNERFYFNSSLSRKIALTIMNNACNVLPINHTNYTYYKSIGVQNIEMLPLGFNQNFLREQKKVSLDKISILTAAELIPLKNIDKVVYAIKNLVFKYRLHYTIIGKGPERKSLSKLVDDLQLNDFVTFIDHVPHHIIADEMYKHDIFIMPSYFETFGRVFFEAMAMGIPIICAKNSGIYGLFKDGEEGISVCHDNIGEITAALEFLISNSEKRMLIGINGQKLVQNFTWEYVAQKLNSHYKKVDY